MSGFTCAKYVTTWLSHFLDESLGLLFGSECAVCGELISTGAICEACDHLEPVVPPFCKRCGYCLPAEMKDCGYCRLGNWSDLSQVRSGFWFDERARLLWGKIKFHRRHELLRALTPLLQVTPIPLEGVLMSVPLPFSRWMSRGFNQSDWIARSAKRAVHSFGLIREGNADPQSLLNAYERAKNVKGSFSWRLKSSPPEKIVLIDDIYTTGSTLRECARILKQAGAKEVTGWTLFRTPYRGHRLSFR